MKQYMKYIKPYLLYFILAPIFMLVEVVGEVVMPKLLANIINIGIPNQDTGYIVGMGFSMAGMAILMMLGGVGGGFFSAKASVSFAAALRKDAFTKVQQFSFANIDKFDDVRHFGWLDYFLFGTFSARIPWGILSKDLFKSCIFRKTYTVHLFVPYAIVEHFI